MTDTELEQRYRALQASFAAAFVNALSTEPAPINPAGATTTDRE